MVAPSGEPLSEPPGEPPKQPSAEDGTVQYGDETAAAAQRSATPPSPSSTSSPTPSPAAPSTPLDDFQTICSLGEGSFGQVYLARQISMQRLVALKISPNQGREHQTLAQLDHPNIVQVYDQITVSEQNSRLLYMQYVPGGTIADLIQHVAQTPWPDRSGALVAESLDVELRKLAFVSLEEPTRQRWEELDWPTVVCTIGRQLADALDYAAREGVLHRDIKPANILLTADGTPKLVDFDISYCQALEADAAKSFGGSLAYMSPEQLDALNPDDPHPPSELNEQADIYSLGVVLWELLLGEKPFPIAEQDAAVPWAERLRKLAGCRRSQSPQVPDWLDNEPCRRDASRLVGSLLRCLAPKAHDRFQTAADLKQALDRCLVPRAAELLEAENRYRNVARRASLWIVLLIALLPNAGAGLFNFIYNRDAIVRPEYASVFFYTQLLINGLAFPIGIAILLYRWWPAHRSLQQRPDDGQLAPPAERMLSMGHFVAMLGVAEWALAGPIYPLCLHAFVGGVSWEMWLHFVASLVLCGLIAAAYPFFAMSFVAVRVFAPRAIVMTERSVATASLQRLLRRGHAYLYVAGGVPMLAILALLINGLYSTQPDTLPLLVLSGLGAMGFAVATLLFRGIRQDTEALLAILRQQSSSH